jgi:hypothetical protein
MPERFSDWIQSFHWGHFIAIGLVLALLSGIRSFDKFLRAKKAGQSVPEPQLRSEGKAQKGIVSGITKSRRVYFMHKLVPASRVLLLFAACVVVLIGIEQMYVQLNPRGRYSRPEVSWLGALLVAGGLITLWICRSWFRDFGRNRSSSPNEEAPLPDFRSTIFNGGVIYCPSCGSPNRLKGNVLTSAARCGECHGPLSF